MPPELDIADRPALALCLSGGGYRAALFHLGALIRLNELGLLGQVTTFSSVSGGSILAGHLAYTLMNRWPAPGAVIPNFEDVVAKPFRRFTRRNIRLPAVLTRANPMHVLDRAPGAHHLQRRYRRLVPLTFAQLPATPRFVFCATDMSFGVNWVFDSRHRFSRGPARPAMGSYKAGYTDQLISVNLPFAMAASSCFPPVFNPMPVPLNDPVNQLLGGTARNEPEFDELVSKMRLTDGGVYDNLGLEPVWKSHGTVLVLDGGSPFSEATSGILGRIWRYYEIIADQGLRMRKRHLFALADCGKLQARYVGISTSPVTLGCPGYDEEPTRQISKFRTDLDSFSASEAEVLENHGYFLLDAILHRYPIFRLPAATFTKSPANNAANSKAIKVGRRARRKLLGHSRFRILGR